MLRKQSCRSYGQFRSQHYGIPVYPVDAAVARILCIVLKFSLLIVSDGKKCSFSLREDTECWYLMLREMWSGRVMSEEQNDPLIRDLAVENALIVDAFLRRFYSPTTTTRCVMKFEFKSDNVPTVNVFSRFEIHLMF